MSRKSIAFFKLPLLHYNIASSFPKRGKIEYPSNIPPLEKGGEGGFEKECKVFHSELWGLRENKYDWLSKHALTSTKWKKINPKSEFYLFIPRDEKLLTQYQAYPKITDIFPVNSVGIVTARDNLTTKWTREEMWQTLLNFSKLDIELARQAYNLGSDVRDWKVELAQKDLKESGLDKKRIVPILYRPFDIRYTYYTGKSRGFHCMPRPEVMQHMIQENLSLCIGRAGQVVGLEKPWNIVFCSNYIEDFNLFYRGGNVNFPLYTYQSKDKPKKRSFSSVMLLFEEQAEYGVKKPNLSPALIERLTKGYKKLFFSDSSFLRKQESRRKELDSRFHGNDSQGITPEDIFYYIYAVLYSNIYRTKYAEFLKIDFPRIPFTKDYKLFKKMGEFGEKLVSLHLSKSTDLDSPVARFQGKGDNKIEKLRYEQGKLYINNSQYFEGVEPEIWEYQIGGYQVCEKWLKDRKDRLLSLDEIKHYCKVVTALKRTIEIQEKIDSMYPEVEKRIG